MDIKDLEGIKKELKRFEAKLYEALERSYANKGYVAEYGTSKGKLVDVGNISGTKESGAIKRAALDLKRELTKITK